MGWFEDAQQTAKTFALASVPAGRTVLAANAINGNGLQLPTGGAGKDSGYGQISGSSSGARANDLEAGYKKGKEIFYDDPDMQMLRERNQDLSKGYNGETLGALRGQAEAETEGQRQSALRDVAGKAARGGIGGARAAAIQGGVDAKLLGNKADLERKLTIDNANQVTSGTKGLQDFIMGQKFGQLGTGLGYAQLGVTDRSADAQAAAANKEQKKGIIGQFLSPLEGLF